MIDIRMILADPDGVRARLAKKGCDADLGKVIELDARRRELIKKNDELKNERNRASAEVPALKKSGQGRFRNHCAHKGDRRRDRGRRQGARSG